MRIHIQCFGILQEVFGGSACEVDVDAEQPTVSDALEQLAADYPAFAPHRPYTACAIGDRLTMANDAVAPEQTLVLLPPVSGG